MSAYAKEVMLTANQLVGYNLARIRKTLGLSQDEAAARLEPYLGARWSKQVYSAAERSWKGTRVRQFDANELLAMSLAFGVPVTYFLLLPSGEILCSGDAEVSRDELRDVLLGSEYGQTAFKLRISELGE